jgi:hypothetical protein
MSVKFTVELNCEMNDAGFIKVSGVRKEISEFDTIQHIVAGDNGKEFKLVGSKGKVFLFPV